MSNSFQLEHKHIALDTLCTTNCLFLKTDDNPSVLHLVVKPQQEAKKKIPLIDPQHSTVSHNQKLGHQNCSQNRRCLFCSVDHHKPLIRTKTFTA